MSHPNSPWVRMQEAETQRVADYWRDQMVPLDFSELLAAITYEALFTMIRRRSSSEARRIFWAAVMQEPP